MPSIGRIKEDQWGNIVIVDDDNIICGFGCRADAKEQTYLYWKDNIGKDCEFRKISNDNRLKKYEGMGHSLVISFLEEEKFLNRKRRFEDHSFHSISSERMGKKERIDEKKIEKEIREKYKDIFRLEIRREMREKVETGDARVKAVEKHLRSLQKEYSEIMIENEKNKSELDSLRATLDEIKGLSTTFN